MKTFNVILYHRGQKVGEQRIRGRDESAVIRRYCKCDAGGGGPVFDQIRAEASEPLPAFNDI